MTRRYVQTFAAMFVALALFAGLLLILAIGRITPIPGTLFIASGTVCDAADCTDPMAVTLPYFPPKSTSADLTAITFQTTFDLQDMPTEIMALYFPKFADHLSVRLNGITIREADMSRRHWSEPVLIPVPLMMLTAQGNTLDVDIYGRRSEGIEVFPVLFGPKTLLEPAHTWRFAVGPSLARFNLVFMLIGGLIFLLIWSNRQHDKRYLWLSMSCFASTMLLLHFGFGLLWGGYKVWTGLLHLSIALYALFNVKFLREHLMLAPLSIEKGLAFILGGFGLVLIVLPQDHLQLWALLVDILTGLSALSALTVFWLFRHHIPRLEFLVMFACLLFASALGVHEMILLHSPGEGRSFHMFHIVPVFMALVCMWVIVSQLLRSLRSYESLTATLNDTIADKTQRLEQSFARIAEVERRKAIDVERNRIMLDLHDGIGGQLVSTLAYMESTGREDPTLKEALEAALRDLALILDSLDSHDSLTTLLGMLRTRLEPLLHDHGLRFNWRIMDDPVVPNAGPSTNLHLARIVQEAITNVIKHAQASTVTVYTDARTIVIADDGVGIDPAIIACSDCAGHGIAGMRQRAADMHASLEIERLSKGTNIVLRFPAAQPDVRPAALNEKVGE